MGVASPIPPAIPGRSMVYPLGQPGPKNPSASNTRPGSGPQPVEEAGAVAAETSSQPSPAANETAGSQKKRIPLPVEDMLFDKVCVSLPGDSSGLGDRLNKNIFEDISLLDAAGSYLAEEFYRFPGISSAPPDAVVGVWSEGVTQTFTTSFALAFRRLVNVDVKLIMRPWANGEEFSSVMTENRLSKAVIVMPFLTPEQIEVIKKVVASTNVSGVVSLVCYGRKIDMGKHDLAKYTSGVTITR